MVRIPIFRDPSRRPRPFSLMEILVVIAIVALLVSLLLPALRQAHSVARTVQCMNHLKQFATAVHLYGDDYQHYPYCQIIGDYDFTYKLSEYISSTANNYSEALGGFNKRSPVIQCPSAAVQDDRFLRQNYAANQHVMISFDQWFNGQVGKPASQFAQARLMGSLPRTATVFLMADATQIYDWVGVNGGASAGVADSNASFFSYRDSYTPDGVLTLHNESASENLLHIPANLTGGLDGDGLGNGSYIRFRHNEKANLLFSDGHVEGMGPWEVMEKHMYANY